MRIAFIHGHASFLPEIQAYHRFFQRRNIETISLGIDEAKKANAAVTWWIMGFSRVKLPDGITIHEYTSASSPPFPSIKNRIKSVFNAKPDYRIFLNDYVRKELGFTDEVPYGLRDMGIDFSFFHPQPKKEKRFDFIYVGNLHPTRGINALLKCFTEGELKQCSLLILSSGYEALASALAPYPNIHFAGPVPPVEVGGYINEARFAINYIPDITPYNSQTSTKLLEYAACRVPIISTSYSWINKFKQQYGGEYFFVDKDLTNLKWEKLNAFRFEFPNLHEWQWELQIAGSGVLELLKKHFPGELDGLDISG